MSAFRRTLGLAVSLLLLIVQGNAQQAKTVSSTSAVLPRLIRVSGTIADGSVRRGGPSGAVFSLYTSESGGAALWTETQSIKLDAQGRYSTLLGANTEEGIPVEMFANGEVRWLGVTIEGREQPRVQIVSVPYAMKAKDAETLNGMTVADITAKILASLQKNAETSSISGANSVATKPTSAMTLAGQSSLATDFTDSNNTQVVNVTQGGTGAGLRASTASTTNNAIAGVNTASTGTVRGVSGQSSSTSTSSAGVYGISSAATGLTYGVLGVTNSNQGTALNGTATSTSGGTIGLRGQANSTLGTGVQGAATAATGTTTGVNGFVLSPGGVAAVFDNRAGGKVLSLRNNGVEKVGVDGAGNVVVNGSLSAVSLTGDGTGITNIPTNTQVYQMVYDHIEPGKAVWAKSQVTTTNTNVFTQSTAVDALGNVIATGYFLGSADFGGGAMASAGQEDIFVAKYDANGKFLWAKVFGGTQNDESTYVAVDPSGNIYITGVFNSTFSFCASCGTLSTQGVGDSFIAKINPSGTALWSKGIGGTGEDDPGGLAVDSNGNVGVGITSDSPSINAGGSTLSSLGSVDVVLVKLNSSGVHQWSNRYGGSSGDYVDGVSFDSSGNLYLAAQYYGASYFGGPLLPAPTNGSILVAKYDSAGSWQWNSPFSGSTTESANAIAATSDGVLITGQIFESLTFGATATTYPGMFVTKLNTSGAVVSASQYGITQSPLCKSMAVDANGNIIIAGYTGAAQDLGGGVMHFGGNIDLFVVKIDSVGGFEWAQEVGDSKYQNALSVALEPNGDPVIAGFFAGHLDLGTGVLPSSNNTTGYVARLHQ